MEDIKSFDREISGEGEAAVERATGGLSRRDFVRGSLLTGVAALAAGALAGCGAQGGNGAAGDDAQEGKKADAPAGSQTKAQAEGVSATGTQGDGWLGAEPVIDEASVSEEVDCDILVAGAGMAGTFAACHAAESGANVLLIEAQEAGHGIRSSSIAGIDSRYQKKQGVTIDRNDIVNDFVNYALNQCDINLVRDWADNSGEAVDWLGDILEDNGYGYILEWSMPPEGRYKNWPTGHGMVNGDGTVVAEKDVQAVMIDHFQKAGGAYRNLTRLVKLIKEGDTVVGAFAETSDGNVLRINAKAVVVATGGYVNNREMYEARQAGLEKSFAGPLNLGTAKGDGIKACLWAGAHMDPFPTTMVFDRGVIRPDEELGHVFDSPEFVHCVFATQPFLKVDKTGRRLTNESSPYDYVLHAAKNSPDHAWYSIWDANWPEDVKRFYTIGCSTMFDREGGNALYSPHIEGTQAQFEGMVESGHLVKADTLDELASGLLIEDVDRFKEEVERYNKAYEKGVDEVFGKDPFRLSAIAQPPFYGMKIGGEPLCTLDGVVVNDKYQVLDQDNYPIEGLYALGNDSGCYYAHTYPNLAAGANAGRCAASGMLLGRRLAEMVK